MINPMKMLGSVKSVTRIGQESVKTTIYAGLGAYKMGLEQVGMAQHLAQSRFNGLVKKGEEAESELLERVNDTREMLAEQVETGINRALKTSCGLDRERLTHLEAKLDRMQAVINGMTDK